MVVFLKTTSSCVEYSIVHHVGTQHCIHSSIQRIYVAFLVRLDRFTQYIYLHMDTTFHIKCEFRSSFITTKLLFSFLA